ncbi:MAG: lactate racemase domain-containing protein [Lachnospiraceae bacterium]|nr:lactate racemase domain-containing protein [Lachnospiraceae bacterium]MDY3343244.1 lactate racemase domain-containing protein [Lachnospiraceae bacterium]
MKELYLTEEEKGISGEQLEKMLDDLLVQYPDAKKVLIIPPDYTRCYSYAGEITQLLYKKLSPSAQIDVMPALGTHMAMNEDEMQKFFGDVVPRDRIIVHHWQTDTVCLGYVPAEVCSEISNGLFPEQIDVEVNHLLVDGGYDLILSVGQVVPHEVVGMANYSKNIFVGTGGREMINKSHMLSAICGMEKALGVIDSPARKVYDYAQQHFIDGKLPLVYLQTVTTRENDTLKLHGLYIGESRKPFEKAAELAQKLNIVHVDHRAKKVVTYLDPEELKTTWVGNKGIYRTRMTVADGGELIVLAPGVIAFGENEEMDKMTRKYGYTGTEHILELYRQGVFEGRLMSAAHLMQGSTEGRFTVTYATKPENLSKEEIESVGYQWADYNEITKRYNPETLKEGWNVLPDGEEVYFVGTPALGLWKVD